MYTTYSLTYRTPYIRCWSCTVNICMYFTSILFFYGHVAPNDASRDSSLPTDHLQCMQLILYLQDAFTIHTGHARSIYACISLQSYPSMAALQQMTHRGILEGPQVTYDIYNSLPNMQIIVYHRQGMCAQYMHYSLVPPGPHCVK